MLPVQSKGRLLCLTIYIDYSGVLDYCVVDNGRHQAGVCGFVLSLLLIRRSSLITLLGQRCNLVLYDGSWRLSFLPSSRSRIVVTNFNKYCDASL